MDIDIDLTISYRVLRFLFVLPVLIKFLYCKTCGSDIEFQETSQCGLEFKLVLKCKKCKYKYIDSCPLFSSAYEINKKICIFNAVTVDISGAEKVL